MPFPEHVDASTLNVIDTASLSPSGEFNFDSGDRLIDLCFPEVNHVGVNSVEGANSTVAMENVYWRNVHIASGKKWGSRSYNMRSALVEDCHVRNINLTNSSEHGWYWALAGQCSDSDMLHFLNCSINNTYGQMVQFSSRNTETDPVLLSGRWPTIYIQNMYGVNVADPTGDRASYPISAFFHENEYISGTSGPRTISNDCSGILAVQSSYIDNRTQAYNTGLILSEGRYITYVDGCIMVGSQFQNNPPVGSGKTALIFRGPYTSNDVEALENFNNGNSNMITKNLDTWVAPPQGRTLVITNNYFAEVNETTYGRAIIRGYDNIYIKGNQGNFDVRINDSVSGSGTASFPFIKGGVETSVCDYVMTEVYSGSLNTDKWFVRNPSTGLLEDKTSEM